MDFGKWLWRGILAIVTIVVLIGAYKLSGDLLRSQVPASPVLATVSLLDGSVLALDQLTLDQDLITVSSPSKDLLMTWDQVSAQSRLVIDPSNLPPSQQRGALYKWLVAVPKSTEFGDGSSENMPQKQFCVSLSAGGNAECYRFSRTPKVSLKQAVCGNGILETGEECDDGNLVDGDGCSQTCHRSLRHEGPLNYPAPRISIQPFADGVLSVFVTLEPYRDDTLQKVSPEHLFLRLASPGNPERVSLDADRLNGYPFLQAILPVGVSVTLDFVDRTSGQDVVYDTQIFDKLEVGATPLKGSAPSVTTPMNIKSPSLDALSFRWVGTDKTIVDQERRLAIDQSDIGHDFSTLVHVQSQFKGEVKVVVQVIDQSVRFTQTIISEGSGDVLVNVQRFPYGRHRLQMNAIFPDGSKTADVVIPFDYQSSGLSISGKTLFQYWQWGGVGLLVFLGLLYVWLRLAVFRPLSPS